MSYLARTVEVGATSEEAACASAMFRGAYELFYSPVQMRVIEVQVVGVGEVSTLCQIEVAGPEDTHLRIKS